MPIYIKSRQHILGMLIVKTLIKLNPADNVPITELETHRLPVVQSNLPLYNALNLFQHGNSKLIFFLIIFYLFLLCYLIVVLYFILYFLFYSFPSFLIIICC